MADPKGKEWKPDQTLYSILFQPHLWTIDGLIKYFFGWGGFLFPWNTFYILLGTLVYQYATPPLEEWKILHWKTISFLLIRNEILLWIINGGWHVILYQMKINGLKRKYHQDWPAESPKFAFGHQTYDNVFWSSTSGVIFWTAYEVLFLHLWATQKLTSIYLNFWDYPIWSILLALLIPIWREFHFYWIHRFIHWKPLYKYVHSLHHRNVNPGPWSGLSMHPIEHLLYYTCVILHMFIPSHPLHMFLNSQHAALTPAGGHHGFEGPLWGFIPTGDYFHYLHHRYFECNYGESTIPLDKWFGTFRDGDKVVGKHTATAGGAATAKTSIWMNGLVIGMGGMLGIVPLFLFVGSAF